MSDRQRRFALAYVETGSAAEAAARSGYRRKNAARTLRSEGVRAALAELARVEVPGGASVATAGEVLAYLTGVLRGELEGAAASPRMKAAELLGKRLGLFSEAAEPAPAPVIVDDLCGLPAEDGALHSGSGPPGDPDEGVRGGMDMSG